VIFIFNTNTETFVNTCIIPNGAKLPLGLSCNKGIITDISNNKYTINDSCKNNKNTSTYVDNSNQQVMCFDNTCGIPSGTLPSGIPFGKLPSGLSCNKGIITDTSNIIYTVDNSCNNNINIGIDADKPNQKVICYDPTCGIPPQNKNIPSDLSCNKGIITDPYNNKYIADESCYNYKYTNTFFHKPLQKVMCYD
jgi:hypothetical protein